MEQPMEAFKCPVCKCVFDTQEKYDAHVQDCDYNHEMTAVSMLLCVDFTSRDLPLKKRYAVMKMGTEHGSRRKMQGELDQASWYITTNCQQFEVHFYARDESHDAMSEAVTGARYKLANHLRKIANFVSDLNIDSL